MLFLAVATLSSCLFYILATYLQGRSWVWHVETAFGLLFLVDYIFSAIASPVFLTYALSQEGLIDLVSTLPAFGSFQPWMISFSFVRYLRVGKAIRVMRYHNLLTNIFPNDDVTIKATLLIVKVVGVVMMTSAIIYGVERGLENSDEGTGAFNEPMWQWHDAFYFTIVTLSTVGYGDILPTSVLSRLLMVAVIIFALTYIPLEVGKLVDAVNARPQFRKGFSRSLIGKQLHVVLALSGGSDTGGADNEFDRDMLERVVAEFFDDDQVASNVSVWVIIMAPSTPSEEISALCRQPKYLSRVVYFKGSVTNPRDMSAVSAEYADCIFLFPSSAVCGDSRAAEETTHLAAKAMRRYIDRTPTDDVLMERVKALSQTGNPRRTVVTVDALHSKHQLLGFGIDHVICLDELKLSMLAVSTLCPAFVPFVANGVRSCAARLRSSPAKRKGHRNKSRAVDEEPSNWLDDYTMGTNYEIYSVPLDVISEDSSLWPMSFSRASRVVYEESKGEVLLLATVEHREPSPASAALRDARERLQRTLSGMRPGNIRDGGGGGGFSATATAAATAAATTGAASEAFAPCASGVAPSGGSAADSLTFSSASSFASVRPAGVFTAAAGTGTGTGASFSRLPATAAATAASSASSSISWPFVRPPDVLAAGTGTGSGGGDGSGGQKKPPDVTFLSNDFLSGLSLGGAASPTRSLASSRLRSPASSIFRNGMDEETKEGLDSIQKQAFLDDEIDWACALEALKRARAQLDELDLDQESAKSPARFFTEVAGVSSSISAALRLHTTSLPPGLKGHVVLVGGNARLQYYILALRRQRPRKPVVVVTEDTESFFVLRDRLVECKFLEMGLDISQIYHVFGRTQDRFTLEEANVAQAETVMLMSDEPNDTAVLLGSFELEQVMEDMPAGEPRPKVLIDLSKDDSIYYCGIVLGGADDMRGPSLASTRSLGQHHNLGQYGGGEDVRYWPLFASGRVWTASIMDVFAVRTYFNAHVLAFFEAVLQIDGRHHRAADGGHGQEQQQQQQQQQRRLQPASVLPQETDPRSSDGGGGGGAATGGGGNNRNNKSSPGRCSYDDSAANQGRSQFAHLHVSASFAGLTYGELAQHLIARGAMPLGLYRPSGTKGSILAYTHVNPSPSELLRPWPARRSTMPREKCACDDDNDHDHEKKKKGRSSVNFEEPVGGGGGGGMKGGEMYARGRRLPEARAGDDVFVLRSRGCLLSGEVSL